MEATSMYINGPETWTLSLPDWGHMDTVWNYPLPFALWTVGEQSLLYHWLDAAVDRGIRRVILLVADRPDEVRKTMEAAKLWPLQWEVKPVARIDPKLSDAIIDSLPGGIQDELEKPTDGWSLIQYWAQLERQWLDIFTKETESYGISAAVGKQCEIADTAKLNPPFWIGDFVSIGPNCSIGPHVVIEDGCMLEGGNMLSNAHMGNHTYLGPETDLNSAMMFRNQLINLKYRARVDNLESFLADKVGNKESDRRKYEPNWKEKAYALLTLYKWRYFRNKSSESFMGIDGNLWPCPAGPLPKDRAIWLKQVILGRMRLFGVTPRTQASIQDLPQDWQSILKDAPIGVFSYADVVGIHDIGTEEEAMHCVYQVKGDTGRCHELFKLWLQKQIRSRDNIRTRPSKEYASENEH